MLSKHVISDASIDTVAKLLVRRGVRLVSKVEPLGQSLQTGRLDRCDSTSVLTDDARLRDGHKGG
jgi:hypothetical protein